MLNIITRESITLFTWDKVTWDKLTTKDASYGGILGNETIVIDGKVINIY